MEASNQNKKRLLLPAIALAAAGILTAGIMTPVLSEAHSGFPNYADINKATKQEQSRLLKSSVYADAPIPSLPDSFIMSNLVYAYSWVDTETGKALAATIHPNFRDSTKNPDHWHMHPMVLGEGTTTSTYCVEAFIDGLSTAEGGVAINGNAMNIAVSSAKARLSPGEVDTVASLILLEDSGCPEIPKLIDGGHTTIRLGAIIHDTSSMTN